MDASYQSITAKPARKSGRRTHGLTSHPSRPVWYNMMRRCTVPKCKAYPRYGGRGITVAERWHVLANFIEDMGPPPFPGATLERRDNDTGYCRDNCRWATRTEQMNNMSRNSIIEHDGTRMTHAEWAREIGISGQALAKRIARWGIARAVTTPAPASASVHRTRGHG